MSLSLFDLTGEVALVTGGGRGIGSRLAAGLASVGAAVAIADRDLSQAEATQAEIKESGGTCLLIAADLAEPDDCNRIVAEASDSLGALTILVNNVGLNVRKQMDEVDERDWDNVLSINLKSYFFTTRRAGREMRKAGHGKVINMASVMGWSVFHNPHGQTYGPYAASKGGVVSLTRAFAVEWARHNIQVNAICPTFIDTPLTRPLRDDPSVFDAIVRRTPMGRFGHVDELVGPTIFLASRASDFITGTSLFVDGGWYAG